MSEKQAQDNSRIYRVGLIEAIPTPDGMEGDDWHRYVIEHPSSKIEGKRSGTLSSVKAYAEDYAEKLNQRALLGYSHYNAKKSAS